MNVVWLYYIALQIILSPIVHSLLVFLSAGVNYSSSFKTNQNINYEFAICSYYTPTVYG